MTSVSPVRPHKLRVAVAEDDDAARWALEQALIDEGFEVVSLEDGFELVDYLQVSTGHAPDAIVTDLKMPGCSGLEGVELARRQGLDVPIFVVSGADTAETRERLGHVGNAMFFPKPVDASELARAIYDVVRLRDPSAHA